VSAALRAAGAVWLLLISLSGCTGLFHSNARPEQVYYLRTHATPADGAGSSAPGGAASLRIGHPLADPGLDSTHIVLLQADHRMNFYAGSRWPAPVSDMIEALAVEKLRGSGDWSAVEDPANPFPTDYLLQLSVRRFEADYTSGSVAPVVYVVLEGIIGRREGRDVLATFSASGSVPAAANRMAEVVGAFERATDAALGELSREAAQAVRGDPQRAAQYGVNPTPSSSRQSQ
jgi:cholesterol transport system auxiliary component